MLFLMQEELLVLWDIFRGREQSLESIIRITQEKGFPVDEKAMATVMPGIKK